MFEGDGDSHRWHRKKMRRSQSRSTHFLVSLAAAREPTHQQCRWFVRPMRRHYSCNPEFSNTVPKPQPLCICKHVIVGCVSKKISKKENVCVCLFVFSYMFLNA
jgi:hypothetical protein